MSICLFIYLLGVLLTACICYFYECESGMLRMSDLCVDIFMVFTSFIGLFMATMLLLVDVYFRHHPDRILWKR